MSDATGFERKILIIEGEPVERSQLADSFRMRLGCEVSAVPNISDALAFLENSDFDLIISDLEKSGDSGLNFLRELARQKRFIPLVFYAADDEPFYRLRCADYAYTFIAKPESEKLLTLVSDVMDWPLKPASNAETGRK